MSLDAVCCGATPQAVAYYNAARAISVRDGEFVLVALKSSETAQSCPMLTNLKASAASSRLLLHVL
jgi:hypothetical protein